MCAWQINFGRALPLTTQKGILQGTLHFWISFYSSNYKVKLPLRQLRAQDFAGQIRRSDAISKKYFANCGVGFGFLLIPKRR